MMKSVSTALAAALLLSACAAGTPTNRPDATRVPQASTAVVAPAGPVGDDNLNAVAWSQNASEHDFIFIQTYRNAKEKILKALKDPAWDALPRDDRAAHPSLKGLKPAVVLDVDETVLDNSPYQARLVRSGTEYNEADRAPWCK